MKRGIGKPLVALTTAAAAVVLGAVPASAAPTSSGISATTDGDCSSGRLSPCLTDDYGLSDGSFGIGLSMSTPDNGQLPDVGLGLDGWLDLSLWSPNQRITAGHRYTATLTMSPVVAEATGAGTAGYGDGTAAVVIFGAYGDGCDLGYAAIGDLSPGQTTAALSFVAKQSCTGFLGLEIQTAAGVGFQSLAQDYVGLILPGSARVQVSGTVRFS